MGYWLLEAFQSCGPAEKSYMPQPLHASFYYERLFPCIWETINRSFMHMALLLAMRMCLRTFSSESTSVPSGKPANVGSCGLILLIFYIFLPCRLSINISMPDHKQFHVAAWHSSNPFYHLVKP